MNKNAKSTGRIVEFTRRDALKLTAAGAVVLAGGSNVVYAAAKAAKAPAKPAKRPRIALQLYSVRRSCGKDVDKVLAQVAKMGYEGVEFAGYHKYGKDPKALRKKLDDLNLIAAGTHIGTRSFTGPNVNKCIDFHKTIGCKFLIAPGDGRFCHKEKSKQLAEDFNKAAEVLKKVGMFCGYHNHSREVSNAEGDKTWLDLFAERTTKDVVIQQDVGWTVHGGKDPVVFIRRYPGRFRIQHFKAEVVRGDKGKKAIIGQDSVKWKDVITASCEVGGAEWFTIEQERYPDRKSDIECSEMSLIGLKKILKEMKM